MKLNNSGRLCVIVDTVTLMTSYTWRHIHPGLKGTTCTPRSCLLHEQVPVLGICCSIIHIPPEYGGILARIYVAYRRQAWLGPFWRQQTCTSFPPFPVTLSRGLYQYCDSLTRTLYPLWPTLEYRECSGLWIVGEDSSPVSRLLSSLCPGIVRHDESVPDIAHPSVNSLTLRSMVNVLTETAGCSCLRVWSDEPMLVWSRRIDTCGRQLFSVQKCTQLVAGELFTLAKQNMVT